MRAPRSTLHPPAPLIKPTIQRNPYEYPPKAPPPPPSELTEEIEKKAAAKGPMSAHWLYLRGAVSYTLLHFAPLSELSAALEHFRVNLTQ